MRKLLFCIHPSASIADVTDNPHGAKLQLAYGVDHSQPTRVFHLAWWHQVAPGGTVFISTNIEGSVELRLIFLPTDIPLKSD